jgi:hypothetical protein
MFEQVLVELVIGLILVFVQAVIEWWLCRKHKNNES